MATNRKTLLVKGFAAVILTPVLAIVAFFGYLFATQESRIFPGTPLPSDYDFEFDVPFEEVTIPVDGAELNALHFRQPNPRGLIFFLHGNGGNLAAWTSEAEYYQSINYDMFMLDYRGYGKSTGRIESESQLHLDVRTAWDRVAPQYTTKPIVIYGRSLGTALAAKLAVDVDSDLVILVSPFTSMIAMARQQYPLLPEWLVRYPMRTDQRIDDIAAPILLVHGSADRLIPLEHSKTLVESAAAATRLLVISGAGHDDIHLFGDYLTGLAAVLPD